MLSHCDDPVVSVVGHSGSAKIGMSNASARGEAPCEPRSFGAVNTWWSSNWPRSVSTHECAGGSTGTASDGHWLRRSRGTGECGKKKRGEAVCMMLQDITAAKTAIVRTRQARKVQLGTWNTEESALTAKDHTTREELRCIKTALTVLERGHGTPKPRPGLPRHLRSKISPHGLTHGHVSSKNTHNKRFFCVYLACAIDVDAVHQSTINTWLALIE